MTCLSNYVEVIPFNDRWILWNKLNGSLVLLEQERIEQCDGQYQLKTADNQVIEYLTAQSFFCLDEWVRKRIIENSKPYKDYRNVKITISVTERCNCACDYCYQAKWRNLDYLLDEEYFNVVINYISELIGEMPKEQGKITIRFFGGEPLLKKEFIIAVIKRIKQLVEQSGKDIAVFYEMDSNCTLLSNNLIEQFDNLSISTTLTLPKDHNYLRSNTFEKTFGNLICAKELFNQNNYNLTIQYNVHHKNVESFEEFLQMIKESGLKCNIDTANIVNYGEENFHNELSNSEYDQIYVNRFVPLLEKYGYNAEDQLPTYGLERSCNALNLLNRKFYSDGSYTPCSFFDRGGNAIRFSTCQDEIFKMPDMCFSCYDYPYCGGKKPCEPCNGSYSHREEMRNRIVRYVEKKLRQHSAIRKK